MRVIVTQKYAQRYEQFGAGENPKDALWAINPQGQLFIKTVQEVGDLNDFYHVIVFPDAAKFGSGWFSGRYDAESKIVTVKSEWDVKNNEILHAPKAVLDKLQRAFPGARIMQF